MAWSSADRGALGFDTFMSDQAPICHIGYNQTNIQFPQYSYIQASVPQSVSFSVENQFTSVLHAGISPYLGGVEPGPMDALAQPQVTSS
jgi:hypothetical protein